MDFDFDLGHAAFELGGHAGKIVAIHHYAVRFHIRQHGDELFLKQLVKCERFVHAQQRLQRGPETERDIGGFGGELCGSFHWRGGETQAGAAAAGDVIRVLHRMAEMHARQRRGIMREIPGILGVGDQHHVVERGDTGYPGAAQHFQAVFRVVENLQDGNIGEQVSESAQCLDLRNLWGLLQREVVAERQIGGLAWYGGEAEPQQIAVQGGGIVRLHREGEHALSPCRRDDLFKRCQGRNRFVWAESGGAYVRCGGLFRGCFVKAQAVSYAFEIVAGEELAEDGGVPFAQGKIFQRLGQWRVGAQGHELLGNACGLGMGDQRISALGGLHGGGCR